MYMVPIGGSPVWGELVLALVILVAIGATIHLYRNQDSRERVMRWAQEMRARSDILLTSLDPVPSTYILILALINWRTVTFRKLLGVRM